MCVGDTGRVRLTGGQQQFVRDASHALRDPLTICRGHLELLGDDPDEQRRAIALVVGELDRIARMIDDLELLAEAERPDFLRLDWIDVTLFAHDLIAEASALASRRWEIDHIAKGTFRADRQRLTEAVMHLAHNAAQHTRSDEAVAIGLSLSENEARIWVRDTGVGVSLSDQERIFERFERGREAHLRYRANGLGLAVVKAIAEAHDGRVEFASRLGEGSTFTIVLPSGGAKAVSQSQPDL
jgi:two-component system, OmpR family, sensor kinase